MIYEWAAAGLIPYRKLPGRKQLHFDPDELAAYDDGHTKLETRRTPGGGIIVRPTLSARKEKVR